MSHHTSTECTFDEAVALLDEEAMFLASEQYWRQYNRLCDIFDVQDEEQAAFADYQV